MTDILTPKQRLAASRAALLVAMGYKPVGTVPRTFEQADERVEKRATVLDRAESRIGRSVVGRWWRRSHLSTVAEIGHPFLQNYAASHPVKLVAYAAGTGSLIVLVRPWRLLSLGMVAGLLMRSTDISGFLSDCLVPELGDTDGPRDDFLDTPLR
ncbi:hypothetical protein [Variovorax boronicumulans]|uniref:hypothetical protein n=1 Tax=Variovorax boronicumulans TaxID=436515 RepID=UPI003392FCDA